MHRRQSDETGRDTVEFLHMDTRRVKYGKGMDSVSELNLKKSLWSFKKESLFTPKMWH